MTWRGAFSGALLLILLEAVVRTDKSATRFGEFFTGAAVLVDAAMSPAVPLIPDLAGGVPYGSYSSGQGSSGDGTGGGFDGGGGGGAGGGGSW